MRALMILAAFVALTCVASAREVCRGPMCPLDAQVKTTVSVAVEAHVVAPVAKAVKVAVAPAKLAVKTAKVVKRRGGKLAKVILPPYRRGR